VASVPAEETSSNRATGAARSSSLQQVLAALAARNVRLEVREGKLRAHAAPGAMTPELQAALGEHRDALIGYLHAQSAPAPEQYPTIVADPSSWHLPFPLNAVQHAYWIGRSSSLQLGGTSTHVYMEFACEPLDTPRLGAAFAQVIARHGMLRAIVEPDGRQRTLAHVDPFRIVEHDLSGYPETRRAEELQRIREQLAQQVIPCEQWPLYLVHVVKLSPAESRLCMAWDFLTVDAWSMLIIVREWHGLYTGLRPLPEPLTVSFRDYVLAEEKCRELPGYARARSYWLDRIDDLPGPPQLPQSQALAGRRYTLRRRSLRLGADRWKALKERARSHGLTPSNILLAAFSEVLALWSETERFCVNLTLFNRLPLHEQVASLVGDFTTLMLVEIDAGRDGSFAQRAEALQQQCLRDMDHRQFSAVELMREINHRRRSSQAAGYPVVFTSTLMLDGGRGESSASLELFGPMVHGISQTPQVSLDCQIFEMDGALLVNWDASDELFLPGVLDDMFAAYLAALETLAADAASWQRERIVAPGSAQQQVRESFNATQAPLVDECLHDAFLRNARAHPQRVAIECGTRILTYAELLAASHGLALQLIERGAARNSLVAVCGEKSAEQVVAVLAVMLAGAAYLPIDSRWPAMRRNQVLAESGVRLVLALPGFAGATDLPPQVESVAVRIDGAGAPPAQVATRQSAADLAYVIFTSGSTGIPKGVMIDHRGAVNTVAHVNRLFGLGEQDKVLAVSELSFDLSVHDIFGTLGAGATLVVPQAALGRDPGHWHALIRQSRVTFWNSAPQLMNVLVDFAESLADGTMPSLRMVLLSGDWIPTRLPERIRKLGAGTRVVSLGGATECSIWSIYFPIDGVDAAWTSIPYGKPLPNQRVHVLDSKLQARPDWVAGDIYIGGSGVALGYWNDAEKTRRSFITHPRSGERLYFTGDKGRHRNDGIIEFLGRRDQQVKVRGNRVELGEISATLLTHPDVGESIVRLTTGQGAQLIAYIVPAAGRQVDVVALRRFLGERLPEYMVPQHFLVLEKMPLSPNGKVAVDALPAPQIVAQPDAAQQQPRSDSERRISQVWSEVLQRDSLRVSDSFFEVGGDSLRLIEVMNRLNGTRAQPLTINELLLHPTIESLAAYLDSATPAGDAKHDAAMPRPVPAEAGETDVAIIGMAGRFPDARDVGELWANVAAGRCSVRQFGDDELLAAGVDAAELAHPGYVKAGIPFPDAGLFDAAYFDFAPAEAAIMDPQQRLLLECATSALEDAGYANERHGGRIGVFVGKGTNFYLYEHLIGNQDLARNADVLGMLSLNEADYAATLVSYKLGLSGPSLNINTACSTSLVAVHAACRSLIDSEECDIAIAGGVTLSSTVTPSGYVHIDGHITSPDGYCRAFSEDANGCVFGSGVGIVVLKPLSRALRDGDTIHAVIKGSAINNDGALKLGFTAPSAQGQSRVIADALRKAGCEAGSIQYIEAHGTGTTLGDPVEFEGLRAVFGGPRASGERCALGSIKTNIGHLGSAAGVAGLIKMVQALRHRQIPPSLHAANPSRKIDFGDSPFFVNGELRAWPAPVSAARRGGVSSFGVGGTNAHIILEEAPAVMPQPVEERDELLVLSARSASALRHNARNLAAALRADPGLNLRDCAYTLQVGRREHEWRSAIICGTRGAAADVLSSDSLALHEFTRQRTPRVVLVVTGEGVPTLAAIHRFYVESAAFREAFDRSADVLRDSAAFDVRELLARRAPADDEYGGAVDLRQVRALQFSSEYALASMWMSLGVKPAALLGVGRGEIVAACLGGVFELESASRLVDAEAQFLRPAGPVACLEVSCPEQQLAELLQASACQIASVDGPRHCVVRGPAAEVESIAERLARLGIASRSVRDDHAFTPFSESQFAPYAEVVSRIALNPASIPLLLSADAGDHSTANYWIRRPATTRRPHAALRRSQAAAGDILLLVGGEWRIDGSESEAEAPRTIATVPRASGAADVRASLLESIGKLWLHGVAIDWEKLHAKHGARRVSLPGYPFERTRHWIQRSATNRLSSVPLAATPRATSGAHAAANGANVAPVDEAQRIQELLTEMWQEILGVERIGINDNFFELGGNSVMATRVFARVKSEFDIELPISKMFECATVRQMYLFISVRRNPGMLEHFSADELQEILAMTEA